MNCPACGYDLTGLPEEHRCPECGFAYDAHTIVVDFRTKFVFWFYLVYVFSFAAWFGFRASSIGLGAQWVVVAVPVWIGVLLWRYHHDDVAGKKARRCILCKGGIVIERSGKKPWRETWEKFDRSHIGWTQGRLRIWNKQGRIVFDAPYRHLGSYKKAKRCAKEMNRLAKVYGDAPGELVDL